MNATATHDTKRGEDVRLRISALSEIADEWASTVRSWRDRHAVYRHDGWPDANMEYFLYQTLVGTWPIDTDRLSGYLTKAMREAKVHTSWSAPDDAYEAAVQEFAAAVTRDPRFCDDLASLLGRIVPAARRSSLSQTLLKVTAPGVPDIYQGSELWDLSLVDPDNRRPVDYDARRALLAEVADAAPATVLERWDEATPKLWLLHRALRVRRARPELFGPGADYRPVEAQGARAANVIAFARAGGAVTVAPRLVIGLGDPPDWCDTRIALPAGRWLDELSGASFSGGPVELATLLRDFPCALLVAAP